MLPGKDPSYAVSIGGNTMTRLVEQYHETDPSQVTREMAVLTQDVERCIGLFKSRFGALPAVGDTIKTGTEDYIVTDREFNGDPNYKVDLPLSITVVNKYER